MLGTGIFGGGMSGLANRPFGDSMHFAATMPCGV